MKLIFTKGNAKLDKRIVNFSLPAGYTCPGAHTCLTWADKLTGKIKDAKAQSIRCFSASQEATFPNVRKSRWENFTKLKQALAEGKEQAAKLIKQSLPKADIVRIHVSGDFFSQEYFDAWLDVIKSTPETTFYAYTKSLHFWHIRKNEIPANFELTASTGGKWDDLIQQEDLNSVVIVNHPTEAGNLVIDHDDSNAYKPGRPKKFALLIHGTQPKGTKSAAAIQRLKKEQIKFSYAKPSKKENGPKINTNTSKRTKITPSLTPVNDLAENIKECSQPHNSAS